MKLKPIIPADVDPIKLADEMKKGMTKRFFREMKEFEKADRLIGKSKISKQEAILIADRIKSGMSIHVFNDLKEIERSQPKVLLAQ